MKRLSMTRLKTVAVFALACAAAHADAAGQTNATGYVYYGNGDGTFGSTNTGYTGTGYPAAQYAGAGFTGAGYAGASYAPGMAGYLATPAINAGYQNFGYAGATYAGYGGYGYGADYGYGGCDTCSGGRWGHRRHCCSFGGNSTCCNNCWDGYCAGAGAYGGAGCGGGACGGGACGGHVKVHRRHRALGCGAGPCVDAACDTCAPRRHHCHLRRRCGYDCGTVDYGYGYNGSVMSGPGAMYDNSYGQPNMGAPNMAAPGGAEQLQSPAPTLNYSEEPQPMPGDDSST